MGKSRLSGGGGVSPQISPQQREDSEKILAEHWGNVISEKEQKEFLDGLIDAGLQIVDYNDQAKSLVITSFDPSNNDVIYIDDEFFIDIRDGGTYSYKDIGEAYKSLPNFLKNGNNDLSSEFGMGNYIDFTGLRDSQSSGWYNPAGNIVHIPATVLFEGKSGGFSLDNVLCHEMAHRADFQHGQRETGKNLPNWQKSFSEFPSFQKISDKKNGTASAYSYSYGFTPTGRKSTAKKSIKYHTENLSETVANVHMIHRYGKDVMVEDPRSGNRSVKITGEKWQEIRSDLSDIGEKIYNCKSYDEFIAIMAGNEDPYG